MKLHCGFQIPTLKPHRFGIWFLLFGISPLVASEPVKESRIGLSCEASAGPRFALDSKAHSMVYTGRISYAFTRQISIGLRFITGTEEFLDASASENGTKQAELGGGGIEASYFFLARSPVRPYVAAGYDLSTIVGDGMPVYNGRGVHGEAGASWAFASNFSLGLGVTYTRTWYRVRGADVPAPFTDERVGVELNIAFFPGVPL